METSLATTLVLGAILTALDGRTGASLGFAAAAGMVRPELALLPTFVLTDSLLRIRPLSKTGALGSTLGAAGASMAPFLLNRICPG